MSSGEKDWNFFINLNNNNNRAYILLSLIKLLNDLCYKC